MDKNTDKDITMDRDTDIDTYTSRKGMDIGHGHGHIQGHEHEHLHGHGHLAWTLGKDMSTRHGHEQPRKDTKPDMDMNNTNGPGYGHCKYRNPTVNFLQE
jgi:hypothetical protein